MYCFCGVYIGSVSWTSQATQEIGQTTAVKKTAIPGSDKLLHGYTWLSWGFNAFVSLF